MEYLFAINTSTFSGGYMKVKLDFFEILQLTGCICTLTISSHRIDLNGSLCVKPGLRLWHSSFSMLSSLPEIHLVSFIGKHKLDKYPSQANQQYYLHISKHSLHCKNSILMVF